jgi:hypothetical protein
VPILFDERKDVMNRPISDAASRQRGEQARKSADSRIALIARDPAASIDHASSRAFVADAATATPASSPRRASVSPDFRLRIV